MSDIIMYGAAIIAVAVVVFMLIKKMDIKITLFLMGVALMFIAMLMGKGISGDFTGTGAPWLDPLKAIADQFKSTLSSAGFIILILGGYSAYMSAIGANDVTVSVLTKPIGHIKSVYILVPVVFLLGNLLSLVIPSASNLAHHPSCHPVPGDGEIRHEQPHRRRHHRHHRHGDAHPLGSDNVADCGRSWRQQPNSRG